MPVKRSSSHRKERVTVGKKTKQRRKLAGPQSLFENGHEINNQMIKTQLLAMGFGAVRSHEERFSTEMISRCKDYQWPCVEKASLHVKHDKELLKVRGKFSVIKRLDSPKKRGGEVFANGGLHIKSSSQDMKRESPVEKKTKFINDTVSPPVGGCLSNNTMNVTKGSKQRKLRDMGVVKNGTSQSQQNVASLKTKKYPCKDKIQTSTSLLRHSSPGTSSGKEKMQKPVVNDMQLGGVACKTKMAVQESGAERPIHLRKKDENVESGVETICEDSESHSKTIESIVHHQGEESTQMQMKDPRNQSCLDMNFDRQQSAKSEHYCGKDTKLLDECGNICAVEPLHRTFSYRDLAYHFEQAPFCKLRPVVNLVRLSDDELLKTNSRNIEIRKLHNQPLKKCAAKRLQHLKRLKNPRKTNTELKDAQNPFKSKSESRQLLSHASMTGDLSLLAGNSVSKEQNHEKSSHLHCLSSPNAVEEDRRKTTTTVKQSPYDRESTFIPSSHKSPLSTNCKVTKTKHKKFLKYKNRHSLKTFSLLVSNRYNKRLNSRAVKCEFSFGTQLINCRSPSKFWRHCSNKSLLIKRKNIPPGAKNFTSSSEEKVPQSNLTCEASSKGDEYVFDTTPSPPVLPFRRVSRDRPQNIVVNAGESPVTCGSTTRDALVCASDQSSPSTRRRRKRWRYGRLNLLKKRRLCLKRKQIPSERPMAVTDAALGDKELPNDVICNSSDVALPQDGTCSMSVEQASTLAFDRLTDASLSALTGSRRAEEDCANDFSCVWCGEVYLSPQELDIHSLTHAEPGDEDLLTETDSTAVACVNESCVVNTVSSGSENSAEVHVSAGSDEDELGHTMLETTHGVLSETNVENTTFVNESSSFRDQPSQNLTVSDSSHTTLVSHLRSIVSHKLSLNPLAPDVRNPLLPPELESVAVDSLRCDNPLESSDSVLAVPSNSDLCDSGLSSFQVDLHDGSREVSPSHHAEVTNVPHHSSEVIALDGSSPTFPCTGCPLTFLTASSRRAHQIEQHSQEEVLKCPQCGYVCGSKHRLLHHCVMAHALARLRCSWCNDKFTSKELRDFHVLLAHPEQGRGLTCSICDVTWICPTSFYQHLRLTHEGAFPFLCWCGKSFSTLFLMKTHVDSHTSALFKLHCSVCFTWHPTKELLDAHRSFFHLNNTPHACPICPKSYRLFSSLNRHVSRTHPDTLSYQCIACGVRLCTPSQFYGHLVQSGHMVEPVAYQYKCRRCNFTSFDRIQVTEHEEVKHNNTLPLNRVVQLFSLLKEITK